MPGYDGTGPRGRGPMTGWGRGYCVLKMPQTPDDPITGFAGMRGEAVTISSPVSHRGAASLETVRRIIGGPPCTVEGGEPLKRPEANAS